jgi:uncharacterized phiE125 gp8 family phage protein
MALKLISPPDVAPVDADDLVKLHARIDGTADDDLLALFTQAATEQAQSYTARALITQGWRLTLDAFPCGNKAIEIPLPPLQTVESITYIDGAGATQTLDDSLYSVDVESEPGRVTPIYGASWPSTRGVPNAVTIEFTAGYGDTGDTVPASLRNWMLLAIQDAYDNRGTVMVGQTVESVPRMRGIGLLDAYRIYGSIY